MSTQKFSHLLTAYLKPWKNKEWKMYMLWRLYISVKHMIKLSMKFNSFLKLNNKICNLSNTRNVSSALNFHSFLEGAGGAHRRYFVKLCIHIYRSLRTEYYWASWPGVSGWTEIIKILILTCCKSPTMGSVSPQKAQSTPILLMDLVCSSQGKANSCPSQTGDHRLLRDQKHIKWQTN